MLTCYFCPGFVFVVRRKANEKWAINFEKYLIPSFLLFMCILELTLIHFCQSG